MGAQLDGLLDVGGARGPGDEVDRARQAAAAVERAHAVPGVLVGADHPGGPEHRDMGFGQEVERGRRPRSRDQQQRPGLGDPGKGPGDRDLVGRLGLAGLDLEQGLAIPWQALELRVRRQADSRRQVGGLQVVGDRGRDVLGPGDAGDRGRLLHRHGLEEIDLLGQRDLRARRHRPARRLGKTRFHARARRVVPIPLPALERAPDGPEDLVAARAHARRPRRRAAQRDWKVRPWGAGKSRARVQPPASGSDRNRPLRPAQAARMRIFRPAPK